MTLAKPSLPLRSSFSMLTMVAMLALSSHTAAYAQNGSKRADILASEANSTDGTYTSLTFSAGVKWTSDQAQPMFARHLGIDGKENKMVFEKTTETKQGTAVHKYVQYYKGIKVALSSVKVMSRDGNVSFVTGNYYKTGEALSATPAISEASALNAALARIGATKYMWEEKTNFPGTSAPPKGELVWVENFSQEEPDRQLHLAYAFNIYASKPLSRDMVYVDANTAEILFVNPLLHHTVANGPSLYSATVSFESSLSGGTYTLYDSTRADGIITHSLANTTGSTDVDVTSTSSTFTSDSASLDAHWGAEKVFDYWLIVHGRNSIDDAGMAIYSYTHYDTGYNNAFWDGSEMIYGDGTGVAAGGFNPLAALDVCAHEIGHGICQYTADLVYSKEPGAMNEGFSDIWGAVIENYADPHETDAVAKSTWRIGEEVRNGNPLRRMDNPNLKNQPDTYGGTNWANVTSCTPSSANDQCGVHKNSGVLNYWFYLLCQGGSGTNDIGNIFSVTGIGITEGAEIAYQTELMLASNATYANCRTASINAALTLYGPCSPEVQAVMKAWYAVGVGSNFTPVSPISGPSEVCEGSSITLTDAPAGGTWSSSNTAVAIVGTSGVALGVSPGTADITYTISPSGCYATKTITVYAVPTAITGTPIVCSGYTTPLNNSVSGGTWSSADMSIATIGTFDGIVTGIAAGTADITYTIGTCTATITATVLASPAAITPASPAVCVGSTTTFTDATIAGTWTVDNPTIGSIDAAGIFSALTGGTVNISYTIPNGCFVTTNATVSPTPSAITGALVICENNGTALGNSVTGGTWSSSDMAVAVVGSSSGIVTGIAPGTADITYAVGSCFTTSTVTVNASPAAMSPAAPTVCVGSTTTFTDAITGGTWAVDNLTIGSIDAAGVFSAVAAGSVNISYTLSNGCFVTTSATVAPIPAAITGTPVVCESSATTLSNSMPGGTWSSSNMAVATVGSSSGIMTGAAAGTSDITYAIGSCFVTRTATVNAAPAAITPVGVSICAGLSTTLTDATAGGTWSSSGPSVGTIDAATGVFTGISAGTSVISYTAANGCFATSTASVNPLPAAITPAGVNICPGMSTTLTDAFAGGTWSSSTPAVGTIDAATGVLTGIAGGTTDISYTLASGCFVTTTATVSLAALPVAGTILGPSDFCQGSLASYTNSTTGGVWSTGIGNATISTSGMATGISAGAEVISYTVSNSCGSVSATKNIVVNATPATGTITGPSMLCMGSSATISSTAGGGVWSSSNPAVAPITSSGIVTGISAGTTALSYSVTNASGCVNFATHIMTIGSGIGTLAVLPTPGATLCDTAQVYMYVTPSLPGLNYQWRLGGTNIPGATSSGYTAGTPGNYSVIVDNGSCSQLLAGTTVSSAPVPVIGFNPPSQLFAGSFAAYQWYLNGVAIPGATSSVLNITGDGSYTLKVTDVNGCSVTSQEYLVKTTGAPAITTAGDIRIYPNPATSVLYIDAPVKVNVSLMSIDGKILAEQKQASSINIGKLPKGMYMVLIYNENDLLLKALKFVKSE